MKKVPKHLAAKARKCVFCDAPGLSRTHIWPEWLNNLLGQHPCRTLRWEKTNYSIGKPAKSFGHQVKQGSIFSQKPLLACVRCNTGWMKSFEDEMNKFAIPIFTASEIVAITWVSLVSVLAEFMDRSGLSVSITKEDRQFIKSNLQPPPEFEAAEACSAPVGVDRRVLKIMCLYGAARAARLPASVIGTNEPPWFLPLFVGRDRPRVLHPFRRGAN